MPFDIGFIELCILLVVALIVLGPDKFPVAARQLSKWFGGIRRNVNSLTSEFNRELEMDELRRQVDAQKQQLKAAVFLGENENENENESVNTHEKAPTDAALTTSAKTDLATSSAFKNEQ
ncbi:Sec-independent protein translocase protein TatB [Glaciecola siphonariae]|uniref:Sec-independent protein translocase protein TatB n=1 Tax=Glaciecola siphonariae TaxID=521012 RepID=A0ABV9LR34_9ALTE